MSTPDLSLPVERIDCVIDGCGWSHWRIPPPVGRATLAGVFSPGVFAAVALASQMADTERALVDHMATHTTLDFLRTIKRLREELKAAPG